MSPPEHEPTSINPNSLKIRFAYRFLHNLNNLNTKTSNLDNINQIHRRSHRVKLAAYSSMAYVVGTRRAWSRAILRNIRNRGVIPRNKRPVDYKTNLHRRRRLLHARSTRPNYSKTKREYLDPFGNSGQELKLRKLVPGAETMDACSLLDETADFIKCLSTQVEVMRNLVDIYSTI